MPKHQPPYTLNNTIISLVADISEAMGRLLVEYERKQSLKLRRINRIRSIQGSLAIEGNTLSEEQITAILDGKRVIASEKEILEANNALEAYDKIEHWQVYEKVDCLAAHKVFMLGLVKEVGLYRSAGLGVTTGEQAVHMAPQADWVDKLMDDLFTWLKSTDVHPLIASCIFHYEFEFIHPFVDGNGRMGRLWQTLILTKWQAVFAYIPVEGLVHQHQDDYYQAIRLSTLQGESTPFIEFMLSMILQALLALLTIKTTHITTHLATHKTTHNQQAILDYLLKHPQTSRKELAQVLLTISENGVKYNLKTLQHLGLLERVGTTRSGHWKVLR